ncbi:MAG: helix-turn-helix domain-containing protein [Deltaproteobacteria bacterium]|jgi:photoactive yellow protein|nr:helix-turn-helix domain-containing protein [Deltaproteobacteria bacterium]MBT6435010.1 helix-turn-helix domain-containing protein [Deltaproteobacteria bacterium]MBT6491790.1 helix-turn-helix domain-containing protein [Deltaproteobacteria bacterium]
MSEELLSSQKAAAILKVAVSTVKRWTDEGLLPCVKTAGGHRRYALSDLERFSSLQGGIADEIPMMDKDKIHDLPLGVIELDDEGNIIFYSKGESKLSGYKAEEVMGRHFFTDVAPCTNNRIVYRPFQEGILKGVLNMEVSYTFTYVMRPTNVRLHLFRHQVTQTNWLLVWHELATEQESTPAAASIEE